MTLPLICDLNTVIQQVPLIESRRQSSALDLVRRRPLIKSLRSYGLDSTDFCHELENYSMDLKRLHRSLTLIYFVLPKSTDFYPEQWVPEAQGCVALGAMDEGRSGDV